MIWINIKNNFEVIFRNFELTVLFELIKLDINPIVYK